MLNSYGAYIHAHISRDFKLNISNHCKNGSYSTFQMKLVLQSTFLNLNFEYYINDPRILMSLLLT